MKRHLLIFFLFTTCCQLYISAQSNYEDVIYLKNGSIYRGLILGQVQDSIYKIEVYGGSTIVLSGNEIQKIAKEQMPIVYDKESRDSIKRVNKRKNLSCGLELSLSYITYIVNPGSNGNFMADFPISISSGGGVSILPEIKKGNHFSILIGASFQYITAKNIEFYFQDQGQYDIILNKGYQIRFEIPLWFRFTYGHKVNYFFQFGWGIGGDFYKGWGSYGQEGGAYQYFSSTGWEVANTGFMSIITCGVGIRKKIAAHTEFISSIEIAPANIQFTDGTYSPYLKFNLGFNFNGKSKKDFRITR